MLLQVSQFFPFYPPSALIPPASPLLSSCPWVAHISSLSPVSYTIFISPHVFYAYQLRFFFPVPFPPIPPFPLPTEIPPRDVHFSDSVPVLVVCLVFVFVVFLFF